MNLTDQLGALESSLDELISAAASIPVSPDSSTDSVADAAVEPAPASGSIAAVVEEKPPVAEPPVAEEKPTLNVSRPEKNLIAMTIGGVSVALSPEGVSELIEELSRSEERRVGKECRYRWSP